MDPPKDLERLNEQARNLYYREDCEIIESLNRLIPAGKPKLRAPDMKFNRQIGDYVGQKYTVEGTAFDGNGTAEAQYQAYLAQVLPGPEDQKTLEPIFKAGGWMSTGTADA